MNRLKIAIQKKGRLSEKSKNLLSSAGFKFTNGGGLMAHGINFPIELIFLRDDDIPEYIDQGVVDLGIVGENLLEEKGYELEKLKALGFGKCKLDLAIPKDAEFKGLSFFQGKRIATSYPNILQNFLSSNGVNASIELISGSVEIAPTLELADGVFDIVSTGTTLKMNGLKPVFTVMKSQAFLVGKKEALENGIVQDLLFRIEAALAAEDFKYILLNAPESKVDEIGEILPGMKSPTVIPLKETGWVSMHSVVPENLFWEKIQALKSAGAQGILVCPIEKMIL